MNDFEMRYFKENDVLHLAISDEDEVDSVELSPNITAELNDSGELIGIEILDATAFIRDYILETAHVKAMNLLSAKERQPSEYG